MMNPEMMKLAQEQMARMTPAQIAAMQNQMKNISPEMMQQAMSQMGNMTPEQMRQARERMASMTPEDIQRETSNIDASKLEELTRQQQGQARYSYNASVSLKTDGNALVAAGKYKEASEKYTRALSNLEGLSLDGVEELRVSCWLNLSLCCLKTDKNEAAHTHCTNVLATGDNVKAYYRRAQALIAMGKKEKARADLKKACELAPKDETVQKAFSDLKSELEQSGGADEAEIAAAEAALEKERAAAKVAREEAERAKKVPLSDSTRDAQLKMMKEHLKKDPDALKKMSEQLSNMDEKQLESISQMGKAQGFGDIKMTPEMAKMAAEMTKNMSPEDLENVMKMQQQMAGGLGGGKAVSPGQMPDAETMAKMQENMAQNPEMMKMAANMMKNISPEQMKAMAKSQGRDMSDDEANKAAEMMKSMKPEHVEKLMKVAGAAQKGIAFFQRVKANLKTPRGMLVAAGIVVLLVSYFWQ